MKKSVKRALLGLFALLVVIIALNFSKLNIISGYAAKSLVSNSFVSGQDLGYIQQNDLNFSPIDIASIGVENQSSYASVFGFMKRKAIYRPGLGGVLINDSYDPEADVLIPNRVQPNLPAPFPYGNGEDIDTVMQGVDYDRIQKIVNAAFDSDSDVVKRQTRTVLVVYKDQIIAEKYAAPFDKNTKVLGWSMTKSLQSTMLGILRDRGFDIMAPAPIPAWAEDDRKQITTHNLLQMNSGLEWVEDYNTISDVTQMLFLDSDMSQTQINKPLAYAPNTHWNYSSGTTNLLSYIIRNELDSHQEYLDFPYASFIDKIGMYSMLIEADLSGNYVGSSYGWATTRDWAKFGLLYLHRGNWNGEQIFDPSWVDYVVSPTPTSDGTYGGQFWLNAGGGYDRLPKNMFSCNGYQGQRVAIFPDQDLVVVRTGLGDEGVFDFHSFYADILDALP